MGACGISGTFYSTDWHCGIGPRFSYSYRTREEIFDEVRGSGIFYIKEEASRMYGDDPYSGSAATVDFYLNKEDLSKKDEDFIEAYMKNRMGKLGKRDGEVVKIGESGFLICTPKIEPISRCNFDSLYYLRNMKKGPAVLLEEYMGQLRVVQEGTVADLKKEAIACMLYHKFNREYYIIGRSNNYLCTCEPKYQKKTTRKSNDKTVVLPVYKWLYYGWAAE